MFYKMYYTLSPPYLSTLVPPLVGQTSRYNLRNANDLQTIDARTTLYFNSFLPSTVRDWNSLPSDIKNADTAVAFKSSLNKNNRCVPKHFYFGDRQLQILHTRLRTKCSSLSYDIFLRRLNDSPLCTCGDMLNIFFCNVLFTSNKDSHLYRVSPNTARSLPTYSYMAILLCR